jgi:hypothetical protein
MSPTDVQMLIFKNPTLLTGKPQDKTVGKEGSGLNTSVNQHPSMIAN